MRIGIPRERLTNETRVAATPKTVEQLLKLGFTVAVESGAGQLASFDDKAFVQAGAEIVEGNSVWQSWDNAGEFYLACAEFGINAKTCGT